MRQGLSVAWLALVLLFGCYDPQIKSGGFTCHPPDHPECPDGLECVGGLCVTAGTVVPMDESADLATASPPPDLAIPSPLPDLARPFVHDLAAAPVHDLATAPIHDLAMPLVPDLAKPACVAKGGDCTYHKDSVCCSSYCIYSSNTCR